MVRLPSAATFNESIFPGVVSCDFKFFELLGSEVIKADVNLKVPLNSQRLVISDYVIWRKNIIQPSLKLRAGLQDGYFGSLHHFPKGYLYLWPSHIY